MSNKVKRVDIKDMSLQDIINEIKILEFKLKIKRKQLLDKMDEEAKNS